MIATLLRQLLRDVRRELGWIAVFGALMSCAAAALGHVPMVEEHLGCLLGEIGYGSGYHPPDVHVPNDVLLGEMPPLHAALELVEYVEHVLQPLSCRQHW